MSRNITIGYFGLINNSFLKQCKDKLCIIENEYFQIRPELVLDANLRQSVEQSLEDLLYRQYKKYISIGSGVTLLVTPILFFTLNYILPLWINLLITFTITTLTLFSIRQSIEIWKSRARSIIVFLFDYLELLSLYNYQIAEQHGLSLIMEEFHDTVADIKDDYNSLLKYLHEYYPRVFNQHLKEVELRKINKDIYIADFTDERYKC